MTCTTWMTWAHRQANPAYLIPHPSFRAQPRRNTAGVVCLRPTGTSQGTVRRALAVQNRTEPGHKWTIRTNSRTKAVIWHNCGNVWSTRFERSRMAMVLICVAHLGRRGQRHRRGSAVNLPMLCCGSRASRARADCAPGRHVSRDPACDESRSLGNSRFVPCAPGDLHIR